MDNGGDHTVGRSGNDGTAPWYRRLLRDDWVRAFALALMLLLVLHLFVIRWVVVESTSMFATLSPGDLVLVQRWPLWTGFSRNDIVVFRDPLKDNLPLMRRPLLVKRIAGMPGDRVELRRGVLRVNDEVVPNAEHGTQAYLVRLRNERYADSLLLALGLPSGLRQPGRALVEVPLNRALAERIEQLPYVIGAEAMSLARAPQRHIFPFSPRYPWNGDDHGPITVPRQGDTLLINVDNLPLYDRLISHYEGHVLSVNGNTLLLDGAPMEQYVVEQDYYFVLGDSRHNSADSRYWGFVPADHLMGRVVPWKWATGIRHVGASPR